MSEILADFDDDSEMTTASKPLQQTTNDRRWSVVESTWDLYSRCEGLCSRVETIAALLEYACETLRPMLDEEQITREMMGARIAFEADWLSAQPLLVFSRQHLESALLLWRQTYGI